MEHILYKTTNLLNDRFYIGMHSTENLDDGYLGSGKRLKAEIKKYGKENFKREILEVQPSRKLLEQREEQVVNEELLSNPLCLNLKNGGEGGGKFSSKEHQRKTASAGGKVGGAKVGKIYAPTLAQRCSDAGTLFTLGFLGKKHSEKTKLRMSASAKGKQDGEKNSQFGTCWVTNGVKPVKIKKEQLDEYLANGYSRGRTIAG